jgi:hypothetical protein
MLGGVRSMEGGAMDFIRAKVAAQGGKIGECAGTMVGNTGKVEDFGHPVDGHGGQVDCCGWKID